MIAVIFEVTPTAEGKAEYLKTAAELKQHLSSIKGFISVERFQSLTDSNRILSLSFWDDEQAVREWRNLSEHRAAQQAGREQLFADYRIRVAGVIRDYSIGSRAEAPADSQHIHPPFS
jgi:heme-degrading monooxygenase HmoA